MSTISNTSPGGFPSTSWSMVANSPESLSALCRLYRPAMRAYLVHRRRIDEHDADDFVQGFITSQWIEKDMLSAADRHAGRFRAFLCTALDRYVANQRRAARARKRMPSTGPPQSLSSDQRVVALQDRPSDPFEVTWAKQTLNEALRRMRRHCDESGRLDVWSVFEARLLRPLLEHSPPASYRELRTRLGLSSPAHASNLLVTAKRMYARCLRSIVAEYVSGEAEIDAELNDLVQVLSAPRAGTARAVIGGGEHRSEET